MKYLSEIETYWSVWSNLSTRCNINNHLLMYIYMLVVPFRCSIKIYRFRFFVLKTLHILLYMYILFFACLFQRKSPVINWSLDHLCCRCNLSSCKNFKYSKKYYGLEYLLIMSMCSCKTRGHNSKSYRIEVLPILSRMMAPDRQALVLIQCSCLY